MGVSTDAKAACREALLAIPAKPRPVAPMSRSKQNQEDRTGMVGISKKIGCVVAGAALLLVSVGANAENFPN